MPLPSTSVIIPVYNGAATIAGAVASVFQQTWKDFELLVVDDGSTDDTMAILRDFADPRLRLLTHERNRGVVQAMRTGVAAARGEVIYRLDADDLAHPTRLARQLEFFDAHFHVDVLGCGADVVTEAGYQLCWQPPETHDALVARLLFTMPFPHSTLAIRREVLKRHNYASSFPLGEDYEFLSRLACQREIQMAALPKALTTMRLSPESFSFRQAAGMEAAVRKVHRRLLRRLGLMPSDRELEIHKALADVTLKGTTRSMPEVDLWLQQLLEANEKTRIYARRALKKELQWRRLCCSEGQPA